MADVAPSAAVQRLIRLVMLSGILIFGAVILYLRSTDGLGSPAVDPERGPFAFVAIGLVMAATVSVFVFRKLMEQSDSDVRRFQLSLVALASCEASALLGGAFWIVSGSWLAYVAGVFVFLFGMTWIPVPAE